MAKQQSDSSFEGMVGVFELLLTFLTYLGAGYNPGPAHLKLPALQARLANLKSLLNEVTASKAAYDAAVSHRAVWYALLPDLATRVVNMLKVLSPKSTVMKAVKSLLAKLRGQRLTDEPLNPDGSPGESNSSSQTTFANKVAQMTMLISLLGQDAKYAPAAPPVGSDEPDLTLVGLGSFRDEMNARNSAVTGKQVPLKQARDARDEAFFDAENGLLVVVQQIKAYVKAVFGVKSAEFKQISGLTFIKHK